MVSIGFLGAGNMGEALIKGILQSEPKANIGFIEAQPERVKYIQKVYKIKALKTITDLGDYDICLVAIKPQTLPLIMSDLASVLPKKVMIVSIAAGITLKYFRSYFKQNKLVRVMPNTPALIGMGMSGIAFSTNCTEKDQKTVTQIFKSVGQVIIVKESQINAVTALSGSGPAYFFHLAHLYASCGPKLGLSYNQALLLMTQTMSGAAHLLQSSEKKPEELIRMVASPGGTTAAALKILQDTKLSDMIGLSVLAAKTRAEELSKTK